MFSMFSSSYTVKTPDVVTAANIIAAALDRLTKAIQSQGISDADKSLLDASLQQLEANALKADKAAGVKR